MIGTAMDSSEWKSMPERDSRQLRRFLEVTSHNSDFYYETVVRGDLERACHTIIRHLLTSLNRWTAQNTTGAPSDLPAAGFRS
jgi:hypothetical protein